jgi:hypothetical protein
MILKHRAHWKPARGIVLGCNRVRIDIGPSPEHYKPCRASVATGLESMIYVYGHTFDSDDCALGIESDTNAWAKAAFVSGAQLKA